MNTTIGELGNMQNFLDWNRSLEKPLVEISYEYEVFKQVQAILSQGEPVDVCKTNKFSSRTCNRGTNSCVLEHPPSTESLQKDKAEMIEYAKKLIEYLTTIVNSQNNNDYQFILSSLGIANFAKEVLSIPQPKCMQVE